MDIFSNNNFTDRAHQLADQAEGDSVTAKRLSITSAGTFKFDYLKDDPVIDYLNENESPHYFFHNISKGIECNESKAGNNSNFASLFVLTDERLLLFADGAKGEEIPLSAIRNVETKKSILVYKISLNTVCHEYNFYVNSADYKFVELENCAKYIEEHLGSDGGDPHQESMSDKSTKAVELDGVEPLWNKGKSPKDNEQSSNALEEKDDTKSFSDRVEEIQQERSGDEDKSNTNDDGKIQTLVEGAKSPSVNEKRLKERNKAIFKELDVNEQPHFIFSGNTTRGFKIKDGSSEKEYVAGMLRPDLHFASFRTILTDKRVILLIIRGGELSNRWDLDYSLITGVSVQVTNRYRQIQFDTAGRKYIVDVSDSLTDFYKGRQSRNQLKLARRFIRKKMKTDGTPENQETADPTPENQDTDQDVDEDIKHTSALEKLERLQKLHEKGALSDQEFEDKKSDLLEEI